MEYVLIVGVGGGVPHYTDYNRHVRLGDVVMAAPNPAGQKFIYQYCQTAKVREAGEVVFETKSWCPPEDILQSVARMVVEDGYACEGPTAWLSNFNNAMEELTNVDDSVNWTRPSADTDKLYMSLGGGDMIEVGHPSPPSPNNDPRQAGFPVLHMGPVAAGRGVALDDQLRQEFAYKNGVLCYDSELDSVVESVYGKQ